MAKKRETAAKATKTLAKTDKSGAMARVPVPDHLLAQFHQLTEGLPAVQHRKTFGSPASYIEGRMFAALHGEDLILKLEPADALIVLNMDDAGLFEPMEGRRMNGWVKVPGSMLQSETELRRWVEKSYEFVKALPPKKK
jgi:TfoX/Sxy family transcriptional regulator of competence genes